MRAMDTTSGGLQGRFSSDVHYRDSAVAKRSLSARPVTINKLGTFVSLRFITVDFSMNVG
jgi:hypothetical protein